MATPTPGSSLLSHRWAELLMWISIFLGWNSNTLKQGSERNNWPRCQKYLAHKDSALCITDPHRFSIYTLAICSYTNGYSMKWECSYMTETYHFSFSFLFLFVSYFFFSWQEEINHSQSLWQLTLWQKPFSLYRIRWCMSWKLREESCYCRINIKIFLQ